MALWYTALRYERKATTVTTTNTEKNTLGLFFALERPEHRNGI